MLLVPSSLNNRSFTPLFLVEFFARAIFELVLTVFIRPSCSYPYSPSTAPPSILKTPSLLNQADSMELIMYGDFALLLLLRFCCTTDCIVLQPAFVPFGLGVRACPGERVTWVELRVIVHRVLEKCVLSSVMVLAIFTPLLSLPLNWSPSAPPYSFVCSPW